ncbi:MAG TPA: PEGA domain-containing protein [Candidatus Wunengus sp. YC60]|uniref:PEGA domain-containing protein n=1 Tax=Candidatus Wunengus sp. YC60 TaxID=3367697 RepID=UPI004028BB98
MKLNRRDYVKYSLFFTQIIFIMLLCLFNLTNCLYSQDAESSEVGMIKAISGKAWIHRGDKKEAAKKAMELKKGDILEIEDQASATIVYFKGGKKEEYKSKALIEIGAEKSTVKEGTVTVVKEPQEKKIITDQKEGSVISHDKDIAHAGGQFIRGILPPKQYFEDQHIQRYAVVVGISDYKDPKIPDLKYADADAQSFYDFITSPIGGNFNKDNVLLLKNEQATLKNVKLAITNFLKKAIDTDFVVIFMACHGEPEPDRPNNIYLLMHDSELDSLSATAYHMENVNTDMKRYISAKRLIFFADACHSAGLMEGGVGTRGFSNTVNIALSELKSTREGWGIVSASRAGEVSMESGQWGGGHGAFTYYLLEGMKGKADAEGNKNGIVTLAESFDFLEENVKRATQNAQHPDTAGNFDNNLPLGFPGIEISANEKGQTTPAPRFGTIRVSTSQEGASIFVGGKEVGTSPLSVKLVSGTYPITIKKKGYADLTDTIFVNPDEKTDIYFELTGGEKREAAKTEPFTFSGTQLEYAESAREREDKQKTKENIDALIKELEAVVKEQTKEEKPKIDKKTKEKKPELIEVPHVVPISLKEFSLKMGLLSNRRDMERLRQRIIDALLSQKGLSVVERDLEFQEEILREQRLSGSILADELFRIGLGKIQGAAFLCFGGISPGDTPDQFVLRMEIVDTATTLVDTLEYTFKTDENLKTVASDVAAKIREKIAAKRKL